MVQNYTPLDLKNFKKPTENLTTILLIIATITAAVLAVVLSILIKRKIEMKPTETVNPTTPPLPTSKVNPSPSLEPTKMLEETTPSATAEGLREPILSPTLKEESPTSSSFLKTTPAAEVKTASPTEVTKPATGKAVGNQ